jgi:hypothetical protein
LHPVWLELQVLQLAAQHHDGAVAAIVPGVGELKGVSARNPELTLTVAPQADTAERNRVVEELQRIPLARCATGLHRALARAQAVNPEKYPCCDEDDRRRFPHGRRL